MKRLNYITFILVSVLLICYCIDSRTDYVVSTLPTWILLPSYVLGQLVNV